MRSVFTGVWLATWIVLWVGIATPVYATTADEHFSLAQKLFKQEKYQQAYKRFEMAYDAGMRTSALTYNLGVSTYRLKHYQTSRTYFTRLLKDQSMRPLAMLNLGLIENKLKNKSNAIKWFKKAYTQTQNKKVRVLAWRALRKVGVQLSKPFTPSTKADISISMGSDSNVADPLNTASNITDTYLELVGSFDRDISSDLTVGGLFLTQKYTTATTYDYSLLALHMEKPLQMGGWDSSWKALFNSSTLGGTSYQSALGAQIDARKPWGQAHDIRWRFRVQSIDSSTRIYLKGTRMKLRAERITRATKNRWRYELELNDRANTATNSYSPTRHTIRYYIREKLGENWKLRAYVGARISTYSPVAGVTRSDQRIRTKIRFKRKLSKSNTLLLEYAYTKNHSSDPGYTYDRQILSVGFRREL